MHDIRKSAAAKSSRIMLPLMGISNHAMPAKLIMITSMKHMIAKGRDFPKINSIGFIGVTISCSIVPISFSLTIAIDVKSRDVMRTIMAITPGTL